MALSAVFGSAWPLALIANLNGAILVLVLARAVRARGQAGSSAPIDGGAPRATPA